MGSTEQNRYHSVSTRGFGRPDKAPRRVVPLWLLLFLIALLLALPTSVLASPGIISEPSFETVTAWTYSTDDNYDDSAQSTTWKTQGTYSYKLGNISGKLSIGGSCQILQSVNFTNLDTISFDCNLIGQEALTFEARVLVGATPVWSEAVLTTATDYLHNEINVSGYTGSWDLIFQIYAVDKPGVMTVTGYFDNIKTWGSFNELAHTTVNNLFDTAGENTAYMFGENFGDTIAYHIGYYDGTNDLVVSEGQTSTSGELSGLCYFPTYQETATAGIWHAVVYKDSVAPGTADSGTINTLTDDALTQADDYWNGWTLEIVTATDGQPPQGESKVVTDFIAATDTLYTANFTANIDAGDTYRLHNSPPETYTPDDPRRTVEDSFEVTEAAIPEFPTVMSSIVVAGLCFGIYYWMRKRG